MARVNFCPEGARGGKNFIKKNDVSPPSYKIIKNDMPPRIKSYI